ncbi:hypothetical protein P7K49_032693 [Saguinus oedipus]|uniref:Uncharacterized protein n=1 Tax=Saguinus oedipus TaxID=9490 RepID=A0ABQ9TPU4_SAGOE|nr:hypothetical protein P7K49_032693 [Saguinus oedipus]
MSPWGEANVESGDFFEPRLQMGKLRSVVAQQKSGRACSVGSCLANLKGAGSWAVAGLHCHSGLWDQAEALSGWANPICAALASVFYLPGVFGDAISSRGIRWVRVQSGCYLATHLVPTLSPPHPCSGLALSGLLSSPGHNLQTTARVLPGCAVSVSGCRLLCVPVVVPDTDGDFQPHPGVAPHGWVLGNWLPTAPCEHGAWRWDRVPAIPREPMDVGPALLGSWHGGLHWAGAEFPPTWNSATMKTFL